MKKKLILLLTLVTPALATFACPACEKQQPRILRGITHGSGPTGNWDYIIVLATAAIVIVTLFFAVKWTLFPGEKNNDHIKRTILN